MAFNFTGFLTDVGNGIGGFLTAIQEPVIYFIIVLGIGAAIVAMIRAIVNRINSGMK